MPFGGFVADTPGFSSFDLDYKDYELKEKLPLLFKDFDSYINDCRFSSCSHTKENGCAVLEAVEKGEIEKTRHDSYVSLYEAMKHLKAWEAKKK